MFDITLLWHIEIMSVHPQVQLANPFNGALVSVDEGMADILTQLWLHKVSTAYSCQGSVTEPRLPTYVSVVGVKSAQWVLACFLAYGWKPTLCPAPLMSAFRGVREMQSHVVTEGFQLTVLPAIETVEHLSCIDHDRYCFYVSPELINEWAAVLQSGIDKCERYNRLNSQEEVRSEILFPYLRAGRLLAPLDRSAERYRLTLISSLKRGQLQSPVHLCTDWAINHSRPNQI